MDNGVLLGIYIFLLAIFLAVASHLLRTRRMELPPLLQEAGTALCGSLWTTFEPDAAEAVLNAIIGGEL